MNSLFTREHISFFIDGAGCTLALSFVALFFGAAAGFIIMLLRINPVLYLRIFARIYVELVQGVPLMVYIFVVYFGLANYGISLPPFIAACLAMIVYISAYLAEIWRGSVQATPQAQWEAAGSLGLTRWQSLRLVVIPQAIPLTLPATVGFIVQVIKMSSLASVIGLVDLTRAGQVLNNSIYEPFLVFGAVGITYFLICYPLTKWSESMEVKLNAANYCSIE